MKKQNNLIMIIVIFGLLTLSCQIAFDILESSFTFLLGDIVSAVLSGLIVAISCILLLYNHNKQYSSVSFKINFFPYLVISILALFSFNLLYSNTLGLIDFTYGPFNIIINTIDNIKLTFFMVLNTCVLAPVVEEYFFRVLILNKLLSKYSVFTSIIFSAFIFGLSHLNYNQFVKAFFMALLLGMIYNHSKSYLLVSILHILNNSFYVIRELFFTNYSLNNGFQASQILLGIFVLLGVILLYKSKKFRNLNLKEVLYFTDK